MSVLSILLGLITLIYVWPSWVTCNIGEADDEVCCVRRTEPLLKS